ncbi:hypothetical protein BCN_0732 [Bacillus cereus NC7401]|nr:hypothetical protein BCN_0732 [Bacillus cereus NC7401]
MKIKNAFSYRKDVLSYYSYLSTQCVVRISTVPINGSVAGLRRAHPSTCS